jgi:hypothetical protein
MATIDSIFAALAPKCFVTMSSNKNDNQEISIPALSASHGSESSVMRDKRFIVTTAKMNSAVTDDGIDLSRVVSIVLDFIFFFSLVLICIAEDLEPELRYLDWVQKGLYHIEPENQPKPSKRGAFHPEK